MNPFTALLVILVLVSSFSLFGALFAYIALPSIKANKKVWELFASYLMILLSVDLLVVHLIRRAVTELPLLLIFEGFLVGAVATFLCMKCYSLIKGTKGHAHSSVGKSIGILVFLLLAIHELAEGAAIAELLFEVSTMSISIYASLFSVAILALHEFPEGLLLVTPFLIEKKFKAGIYASFINQSLFIASGVFVYRFVLISFEPSIAQEAFIATLPAGGIFYLGLHELHNALEQSRDLKLFYSNYKLKIICLFTSLVVLGSLYFVYKNVQDEKAGKGHEILCEQEISLEHCFVH